MSQTRDRHILTPAEYENIVKRHVADAEGVTEDDTSLAHIQKQANAIRGLGQQAALNRLVRSLQRAEQWQKDKQVLQETYDRWVADGRPTSAIDVSAGIRGFKLKDE